MTVKKALEIAESSKGKGISVIVDVRDILEILDLIAADPCEDYGENGLKAINQAIYEINEMNIDVPYEMRIVNDMGNVEKIRAV